MNKLKLAYFGSPSFSADFLEKILKDKTLPIEVKLVVTQPDKPVGRKRIITATPVKQTAIKYQISKIKNQKEIINLKSEISQIDICLVYAYAKIIPKEFLAIPKYGFWNIHPSLLPKYRGPSPIAFPLILGDKKTGVTIIKMDEKIDHGPIIAQEEIKILPDDKRIDLEKKLTDLAFNLFKKIITTNPPHANQPQLSAQTHPLATYTRLLKKDDGFIPLAMLKRALNNQPLTLEQLPEIVKEYLSKYQISNTFPRCFAYRSRRIKYQNDILKIKSEKFNSSLITYNLFRALYPWPGVWTILPNGKRLKIKEVKIENDKLKIILLQLEGKKEVDFETFNRAYKIF